MADLNDNDRHAQSQQSPLASQRAMESGSQQARSGWFPLGAKEGFNQWVRRTAYFVPGGLILLTWAKWASMSPAAAEHKVLSFLPYLQQPPTQAQTGNRVETKAGTNAGTNAEEEDDLSKSVSRSAESSSADPYGPRRWQSSLVKLAGKDRALNEFSVERIDEQVDNNLVILHGYGAGLGFFFKNFEPLSRQSGWRLYALDMLGMGRSSRPPFRIHAKDKEGKIAETESFFVDSLEEWRQKKGIERFTLMGHSLGGYLAVCYALKYPGHLNKLILASPVGIPEDPYAVSSELPEPGSSTLAEEFAQDQQDSTSKSTTKQPGAPAEPKRRPLPKWLTYLWDANVSPFSLVRWSGPLGPRLVSGWTSRRFSQLPAEEASALHDYAYSLFRQRGSGEYALAYILAPGAFARSPLIRRVGGIGRGLIPASSVGVNGSGSTSEVQAATSNTSTSDAASPGSVRERGLPVTLLYGEHDWMDVAGGFATVEKMREAKERATKGMSAQEAARDEGEARVLIVQKAGHHVYLDGWKEFNTMIKQEMEDVEQREARRKREVSKNED